MLIKSVIHSAEEHFDSLISYLEIYSGKNENARRDFLKHRSMSGEIVTTGPCLRAAEVSHTCEGMG